MMNEDVKNLWTAALLSGEYKQGHKRLTSIRDGVEADCCLGVLCKIAVAQGLDITIERSDMEDVVYYEDSISILPLSVMLWAGIEEGNPVVEDVKYGRNSLAEFNDEGKTFGEIAEIIERNL